LSKINKQKMGFNTKSSPQLQNYKTLINGESEVKILNESGGLDIRVKIY